MHLCMDECLHTVQGQDYDNQIGTWALVPSVPVWLLTGGVAPELGGERLLQVGTVAVALLMGMASLIYATAGQAGGTAFLAVMAFAAVPPELMRPTSLALNVLVAGYATWRLHRAGAIDWPLLKTLVLTSAPAALVGGLIVLPGRTYLALTGCLLLLAAGLMVLRPNGDAGRGHHAGRAAVLSVGAGTGFLSGLTGVGGGVFLAPLLILLGWTSPRQAVGLSAPFILVNSALSFGGAFVAGQRTATGIALYALATLVGAIAGTSIGLRWMSQTTTRWVLALILLFAGTRLLLA